MGGHGSGAMLDIGESTLVVFVAARTRHGRHTSRTVIKTAPQPAQHRAILLQLSPRALSSAG